MAIEGPNLVDVSKAGDVPKDGSAEASVSKSRELFTALRRVRGAKHLIIIQGVPDPDAISSAMALDFIASKFEIETTYLAFSKVSHHENRALVKRLGINLQQYDQNMDLSKFDCYSILDSQRYNTPIDNRITEAGLEFLVFVDHHRKGEAFNPQAAFVDVREHAGSTAAIFCEYLEAALKHGMEPSDPDQTRLATSLMHGIRSDTSKFHTATKLDYDGAAFLASAVDHNTIEIIERRVLSPMTLDILQNALVNHSLHDNFIFSDVGYVRAADRDGIPQAAELLLDREGTDTVLVYGIVDEEYVDGSFRTRSEMISPDEFLKGFLGVSPESGQYYGGGNIRDRGGFQIPLGFLCRFEEKSQIYSMTREIMYNLFLDYIGKTGKVDLNASQAPAPASGGSKSQILF